MGLLKAGSYDEGNIRGSEHGASVCLILDRSEPGGGPRLHRHPYDETWIVQEGNLTFQLGESLLAVGPGDIVIAPPQVAHKFRNEGRGPSRMVCIHSHPTMVTEWLE